jgi:hypothetical protein
VTSILPRALLAFSLATLLPAAGLASDAVSPEPFFQRLEDAGMSTAYLRSLSRRLEIHAHDNGGWPAWYEGNETIEVPDSYLVPDTYRFRSDLSATEVAALVEAYLDAANDLDLSEEAPVGSVGREHYECRRDLWANFVNDPDHQFLGFIPVKPTLKAERVMAIFVRRAIHQVLVAAETPDAPVEEFGLVSVRPPADPAMGEFPDPLGWDETYRDAQKLRMYRNLLGLNPPRDTAELRARMARPTPLLRQRVPVRARRGRLGRAIARRPFGI